MRKPPKISKQTAAQRARETQDAEHWRALCALMQDGASIRISNQQKAYYWAHHGESVQVSIRDATIGWVLDGQSQHLTLEQFLDLEK